MGCQHRAILRQVSVRFDEANLVSFCRQLRALGLVCLSRRG
jgi:hypothetical protein